MERKEVGRFGEAAAAMAATTALWSLLHHLAQGCAGYLGLARLSDNYSLKAPAATPQQVATVSSDHELQTEEKEDVTVVEVQSRSMVLQRNQRTNQGERIKENQRTNQGVADLLMVLQRNQRTNQGDAATHTTFLVRTAYDAAAGQPLRRWAAALPSDLESYTFRT